MLCFACMYVIVGFKMLCFACMYVIVGFKD